MNEWILKTLVWICFGYFIFNGPSLRWSNVWTANGVPGRREARQLVMSTSRCSSKLVPISLWDVFWKSISEGEWKERGLTSLLFYDSPSTSSSLRITKVIVGETKVVRHFVVDTSTPDEIHTILISIWSLHVQKKHSFNSVVFHATSVISTSGIFVHIVPLSLSRW